MRTDTRAKSVDEPLQNEKNMATVDASALIISADHHFGIAKAYLEEAMNAKDKKKENSSLLLSKSNLLQATKEMATALTVNLRLEKKDDLPFNMYISSLPKSGSVYVWMALTKGLNLTPERVSVELTGEELLDPYRIDRVSEVGGYALHGAFYPHTTNEIVLNEKIPQIHVHVRDPRQSLLSWVHYMSQPVAIKNIKNPAMWVNIYKDYIDSSIEERIDYSLKHFLPKLVRYLTGWMSFYNSPVRKTQILITQHSELADNSELYFNKVLDFYKLDSQLFVPPAEPKQGENHFRSGKNDEWRGVFNNVQIELAQSCLSDELLEFYGWER